MAKNPYIPLYLGDWTQDTDGLTIEAEGAWLRIIFKCWRNEGDFSATVEILARICKVTPEKFASILLEWKMNKICDIITHDNGVITLTSRRMKADIAKSAVKAVSGSKGGSKTQANIKQNKKSAQAKSEYEYDNATDNDNEFQLMNDVEEKLKEAFDEIYLDQEPMKWRHLDFNFELETFKNKVRGSPDDYTSHDKNGIRKAFQYQLRNSKGKPKHGTTGKNDRTEHNANELAIIAAHVAASRK